MKKLFILCLLIFFIPYTCSAEEDSINSVEKIVESTDFSEIEQFVERSGSGINFKELMEKIINGGQGIEISEILAYIKESFVHESKNVFAIMLKLSAVSILLSFIKELKPEAFSVSVNNAAFFVCYMIIAFFLAEVFIWSIDIAKEVIYNINSLISMSMPLLMTFMAGSGAAKTAAFVNPVILIGIEVISVLTSSFFIPLIFVSGVLGVFSPLVSNIDILVISKTIKSLLKWSMGLVFTLFAGLVSIYGSVGANSDALTYRAAKYVVGSALPVVGTLLSDTMGMFTYSCAVVKNAFGTAVIFIIIFIMLIPVVKLFSVMIILNISSAFIQSVSDKKISEAVSETGGVISYLLGLVCLTAVLFIICIALIIHTAGSF